MERKYFLEKNGFLHWLNLCLSAAKMLLEEFYPIICQCVVDLGKQQKTIDRNSPSTVFYAFAVFLSISETSLFKKEHFRLSHLVRHMQ